MSDCDIAPELRPYRAEVEEAVITGNSEKLKAIVEKAGLEWRDPELPEKYKSDTYRQNKL